MQLRKVKIIGTGKYLPGRMVTDEELDHKLNAAAGWVGSMTGVGTRHYAEDGETASAMGAQAATAALEAAGLGFADIDCLVCASGTKEQPLPCTAALIQQALGQEHSGVPCLDIDSTCLSFMVAMDVMSYMIAAGRYRHVLIVSSEIASRGLNWEHKESAALFGDGAAAVVLGSAAASERSAILHTELNTYSSGARLSEIRGGGSALHAKHHTAQTAPDYLFQMDGHGIFRMASRLLPPFVDKLLERSGTAMEDFQLVIPHQGSAMAMRLLRKKLGIGETQMMDITRHHGNTISASIPMGLHEAIIQGRINRGDRLLLIGTAAGLTLGGMVIDY